MPLFIDRAAAWSTRAGLKPEDRFKRKIIPRESPPVCGLPDAQPGVQVPAPHAVEALAAAAAEADVRAGAGNRHGLLLRGGANRQEEMTSSSSADAFGARIAVFLENRLSVPENGPSLTNVPKIFWVKY